MLLSTAVFGPAPSHAEDEGAAVSALRKVADDLMHAQRQGTIPSFRRVIDRHADVPAIAMYSLGQYRERLPKSDYPSYYKGVAAFMARYFADQSRSYQVVKADIGRARPDRSGETLIDSRVYLASGGAYNVIWRLRRADKGFKVTDVSVLGFSLTYLQRGIFMNYLTKKGGDVSALVAALNR